MADGLEKFIKFGDEDEEIKRILEGHAHSSEDGSENFDAEDGLQTPDIKPVKNLDGKPIIVVIDDDYATLDIMKIYLSRDYECSAFSDPKEAIFYLNSHLPDIVFVDSYMTVMATKRIVSIIRSYKEMAEVPIYYMVYKEEEDVFNSRPEPGIEGIITRPIARGDLQRILDREKMREFVSA
ncbi:MAG: response regulator [Lachnospiraceae bacterium]|nr:response regulator [Lachnospiraceae bacterium]